MAEVPFSGNDSSLRPRRLWASLQRILQFAWPYRLRLGLALLCTVVSTVIVLIVPLGLRELLDAVFEEADRALLTTLTLGLLVLFVLRAAAAFGGRYLLRWTGQRVVADLRISVYRHLHEQGLSFFDDHRTGDLTSRLTNDVDAIRSAVTQALSNLLTRSLSLLGSVALMVALNWRLSLIIFLIVPAIMGFAIYFGRKIRGLARRVQDELADATALAEEALTNAWIVKALARSEYEVSRYADAVEDWFDTARYRILVSSLFTSTAGLLSFSALVGIFWYGGLEVLAGRLTVGDLVAFIFYAFNIARSVGGLSRLYTTLNSAAGATERLFELLHREPDLRDPADPQPLPTLDGRVQLQNVTFAYEDGDPVLHNVTLDVPAGDTVALVGPSGAGKSTLISLLPRLYDPLEGRILLDGIDLHHVSRRALRKQIAAVSQSVSLFDTSIRENIRYGHLDATDTDIRTAARAANAHGFITKFPDGYESTVGEQGVKLSGGQRQRIAIARALLRDPRLLLLDEATSSLDSASEALVQEALERLIEGRTTFIIAHRLSTVQDADRIFVLDEGRVVQTGTHEALIQKEGLYRTLASYQFHVPADPSS